MEQVGMHVVPPRHFDNSRPRRQARLNDPQLLRCRPSPPPLGTGKDRDRAHVRSLICYSVSKPRTREDSKKGGVRRTLTNNKRTHKWQIARRGWPTSKEKNTESNPEL